MSILQLSSLVISIIHNQLSSYGISHLPLVLNLARFSLKTYSTLNALVSPSIVLSSKHQKSQGTFKYSDCFAWSYTEMSGLSQELVEHQLPIKSGFRPCKQWPRSFRPNLHPRIKDEIHQLLEANFIRPCRYVEWVSNIVPVEKRLR
jgi:hypothetical protein